MSEQIPCPPEKEDPAQPEKVQPETDEPGWLTRQFSRLHSGKNRGPGSMDPSEGRGG